MDEVMMDKNEAAMMLRRVVKVHEGILKTALKAGLSQDQAKIAEEHVSFDVKLIGMLAEEVINTEYAPSMLFWLIFSYYALRIENSEHSDAVVEGAILAMNNASRKVAKEAGADKLFKMTI